MEEVKPSTLIQRRWRAKHPGAEKAYEQSEKGKARRRRYDQSEKGKATQRHYNASEKGVARQRDYGFFRVRGF